MEDELGEPMIVIIWSDKTEGRTSDLVVYARVHELRIVISLIPRLYNLSCILWYGQVETVHACSTHS